MRDYRILGGIMLKILSGIGYWGDYVKDIVRDYRILGGLC